MSGSTGSPHPADAERPRDIQEARLSERAEARLKALASATGQSMWVADRQGNLLSTIGWQDYLGIHPRASLDAAWGAVAHPDDLPRALAAWDKAVMEGKPFTIEQRVRRDDGIYRTFSVRGAPVLDSRGQVVEWAGMMTDVTERKATEERLRETERRYTATFEHAPVGIAHVSIDGKWLRMNAKLCEILGDSAEELRARTFQEMTHPDDLEADLAYRRQLLNGEIASYGIEKRYIRKDGRFIWGNLTVSLMRDEAGQPAYFISIIEDITERRRQERVRDQMTHIVSHELKTPLTSIKMLAQVAQRSLSAAHRKEATRMERILEGVRRMELLINDLVDAARLGTGKVAIEPATTDLVVLCRHASDEQALASGRAITLELPAEPLPVRADPLRIGQVLANLLSNALKYSPAERPVTLSLTRAGDVARVSVRDEGPGIPAEARAQLFEQYYRVPGIEVVHGSGVGLGLGLFISRRLVELHGGQMGVESAPGQGSTFWFTLPLDA